MIEVFLLFVAMILAIVVFALVDFLVDKFIINPEKKD